MRLLTTTQIEQEIGRRLKRRRLELNLSQEGAALHSGLSRRTITSVEHGHGATLATVIELLRALDGLDVLENLLPNPGPSPLALARLQMQEEPFRYNASKPRRKPDPAGWKWGDEK